MITDPTTHLFWITSRAAGTSALVLSSVSVSLGLVMGGRLRRGAGAADTRPGVTADRRAYHEILGLAVIAAVVVHGLSLLGDSYLKASFLDLTVPLLSGYRSVWTSIGIIAGWGLVFLGLGYYLRARIGPRRFKIMHRFTVLFWAMGLAHALGEGTDAGSAWFIALVIITAAPVLVLFPLRVLRGHSASAARRPNAPTPIPRKITAKASTMQG